MAQPTVWARPATYDLSPTGLESSRSASYSGQHRIGDEITAVNGSAHPSRD